MNTPKTYPLKAVLWAYLFGIIGGFALGLGSAGQLIEWKKEHEQLQRTKVWLKQTITNLVAITNIRSAEIVIGTNNLRPDTFKTNLFHGIYLTNLVAPNWSGMITNFEEWVEPEPRYKGPITLL